MHCPEADLTVPLAHPPALSILRWSTSSVDTMKSSVVARLSWRPASWPSAGKETRGEEGCEGAGKFS